MYDSWGHNFKQIKKDKSHSTQEVFSGQSHQKQFWCPAFLSGFWLSLSIVWPANVSLSTVFCKSVWAEGLWQSQARHLFPAGSHHSAWHNMGPGLLLIWLPDHCGPLPLLYPELTARSAQPASVQPCGYVTVNMTEMVTLGKYTYINEWSTSLGIGCIFQWQLWL